MNSNCLISIIIPCYNHGAFLREAINSVESNASSERFEIIINNDGSTDDCTLFELQKLEQEGYTIMHQINQGLAAARNNAISIAKGKYIIPLDSDNKLHENYLTIAIDILESNPLVDVVYGNPYFFGIEEGYRLIGDFDFFKIIRGNYIDACAVFKREIWERVKGYDGNMPVMGHEDWEFWINVYFNGGKFHYLNEPGFYYRSLPNSMAKTLANPSEHLNRNYIYQKHSARLVNMLIESKDRISYVAKYMRSNKLKSIVKILLGKSI